MIPALTRIQSVNVMTRYSTTQLKTGAAKNHLVRGGGIKTGTMFGMVKRSAKVKSGGELVPDAMVVL